MKVCLKKSGEFPKKNEILVIRKFIQFLQSELPLNQEVRITFIDSREVPMTTGVRMPDNEIVVLAKGRLLIDILRTISHEWVHEFQYQKMGVRDDVKIQDIGGPEENMCNILSGIFIKKFEKKYPELNDINYGETINEEVISEISLKSSGLDELNKLVKNKREYIKGEMDEIERAVQDLSRDGNLKTTVKDVTNAFNKVSEVDLTPYIWFKLENTESNQIKKGEMKKVEALANQYNKSSPLKLKKSLLKGDYDRPMILKFGDRYHLVAGNTRLCTAAAMGMTPKVLIAEV